MNNTIQASDGGRHDRALRNVLALLGDFIFFSLGFAFYDPLIVVPAFVNEATGSQVLVGALATIRALMTTLPQVWVASVLETRSRMKPVLIAASLMGRLPILLLVGAVLWWAESHPMLTMATLALSVMLFFASEGLNGVTWPVLVGKVVPEGFRGRFFGLGQLLSSGGAMAAGYAVNYLLNLQGVTWAVRWALVFSAAFFWLMMSVLSMSLIREAPQPPVAERVDIRRSMRAMRGYLREDPRLRRLILVQVVTFTASAPFTFVVVRAGQVLAESQARVGTFLVLQSVGSAVAAMLGGFLVDHVGSWAALRVASALEVVALATVTLAGIGIYPLVGYGLAFFLIGYINSSLWWSFSVYLLEIAPEARRPAYLAATGILVSVTAFNSLIVGALLSHLAAEAIFAGAALLALVGLRLAWGLRVDSSHLPRGSAAT